MPMPLILDTFPINETIKLHSIYNMDNLALIYWRKYVTKFILAKILLTAIWRERILKMMAFVVSIARASVYYYFGNNLLYCTENNLLEGKIRDVIRLIRWLVITLNFTNLMEVFWNLVSFGCGLENFKRTKKKNNEETKQRCLMW